MVLAGFPEATWVMLVVCRPNYMKHSLSMELLCRRSWIKHPYFVLWSHPMSMPIAGCNSQGISTRYLTAWLLGMGRAKEVTALGELLER